MYRSYYDKSYQLPPGPPVKKPIEHKQETHELPVKKHVSPSPLDFLSKLAIDDIILLVIIFMLFTDEDSDKTLLAILGFLFISGF
jgi:hypothetical protein